MDEQTNKHLSELIAQPVEMIELLSSGHILDEAPSPVATVDCHPGTPIVFSFKTASVAYTCNSGAIVDVTIFPKAFSPDDLFQDDPVLYSEGCFIVRTPIIHLLEGPHGDCFWSQKFYIDSVSFIYRKSGDEYGGLAAVVFTFHDSNQFGISAAHESHFSYCFNNHCAQLINEVKNSDKHFVETIYRQGSNPRSADSLLWMV